MRGAASTPVAKAPVTSLSNRKLYVTRKSGWRERMDEEVNYQKLLMLLMYRNLLTSVQGMKYIVFVKWGE